MKENWIQLSSLFLSTLSYLTPFLLSAFICQWTSLMRAQYDQFAPKCCQYIVHIEGHFLDLANCSEREAGVLPEGVGKMGSLGAFATLLMGNNYRLCAIKDSVPRISTRILNGFISCNIMRSCYASIHVIKAKSFLFYRCCGFCLTNKDIKRARIFLQHGGCNFLNLSHVL